MKTGESCGICSWILLGGLVLLLLPVAAGAWTHSGNATVERKLGVGTESPARGIHLVGSDAVFRMDRDRYSSAFMLVRTAAGDFNTIWKSFSIGVSASGVNNGVFTIADKDTSAGGSGPVRFSIDNDGRVEIGSEVNPEAGLHIRNPVAGHNLRIHNSSGNEVLTIQDDGDIYAFGEDLELRITDSTSGGYALGDTSTLLASTEGGSGEESFLALNGETAIICSPGDDGILQLIDQDTYATSVVFESYMIDVMYEGDYLIQNTKQQSNDDLILRTSGEQMQFATDMDNNTPQAVAFSWYNDGGGASDKHMDLASGTGNLRIKGSLFQNTSFDLAEAYWKSEDGIEAGDVICIDPAQPNAVVLARVPGDRTVVGVVSTEPGIVMGGSSFSAEHLADLWGKDIAARFAKTRPNIEADLAKNNEYIQGRLAQVSRQKAALPKGGKQAKAAAENYAREKQQLADAMEEAAIEAFCRENLALVALAGRVPVKVDASYGAIQVGDLLVASATPGRAMRADNPLSGTIIGKALEPFAAGQGEIMMMVLNR